MTDMPERETDNWEIWAKRLFVLSFALLGSVFLLQGIGVLQFPEPAKAKQKPVRAGGLRCDEPVWDFGSVDSVKKPRLTHEFVLVNESKEPVTIQKIHSTCGCMVAEGYDKELLPGGSTKLRVDVQLPLTPSNFNKSLAVQTNEGVLPLNVIGEIGANSSLYSVPAKINFGTIHPGETAERIVQVFRHDLSDVMGDDVSVYIDGFICRCEIVSHSESYKMIIKTQMSTETNELPPSLAVGEMVVKTNNPHYPVLKIPVSVRVLKDAVDQ